jgi:type I restriction enzyme S subunit
MANANGPKVKIAEIGMIPQEWDVGILDSFLEWITYGFTCPMSTSVDGPYMITAKDLEGNRIDYETARKTTKADFHEKLTDKSRPKRNDILLSKDGTLGRVALVGDEQICINQSVALLRPNKRILPKFLYYLLLAPYYQKRMDMDSDGSVLKHIYITRVNLMEVAVPQVLEQQSIVEILSCLDLKIELNQKMNKTLDAIGQAVLKRWFVDFEFPNEEGIPYKSSGGEMTESEKGWIPKGWEVKELSSFGRVVCGKTPPKANKEFFGGDVPFIKIPDMHDQPFVIKTEDTLSDEGKRYQANKNIPPNSICVSCIATIGLVSITTKESQTNQQINCIVPQEEFLMPYLFYTMRSLKEELKDLGSGGSATLNVNTNTFASIRLIAPKTNVMKEFYRIVAPLFVKMRANLLENRTLSQIRDSLLPKLMSGKIRVPVSKENLEAQ